MDQSARVQWNIGDVLARSWEIFKDNVGVFLGGILMIMAVSVLISFISQAGQLAVRAAFHGERSTLAILLTAGIAIVFGLIGSLVQTFLTLGYIRAALAAVRGQTPEFGVLFSAGPFFLTGFLASLLAGIGVAIGIVLCIVPGVFLALGLYFVQFIVVDREGGIGVIDALKESWQLTDGYKGALFLWALVSIGLILAGTLACCVGVFVAAPLIWIGMAVIYDMLARPQGSALPSAV
jgi:uncharacterized membrane protein